MPNNYARDKEYIQYFRTTCGLIGFIVFFLGAFFAFIFAEETGEYKLYTIVLGIVMLAVTTVFFCCVMHLSKDLHSTIEFQPEQELLLQPQSGRELPPPPQSGRELPPPPQSGQELPIQPEQNLSGKQKTEPHWADKSRVDSAYIRNILDISPRESDYTTSSGNNSDPDMLELQKMANSGLPTGSEEPMAGASTELGDKDSTRCEGTTGFLLDSTKAGQLNVAGRFRKDCSDFGSESRYDDFPLIDKSALSLSDSSNCNTGSKDEQAEVSFALSRFSLDDPEKQTSEKEIQDPSSTDSEGKLDGHSQHSETSIKAEDGESSKVDSKIEA